MFWVKCNSRDVISYHDCSVRVHMNMQYDTIYCSKVWPRKDSLFEYAAWFEKWQLGSQGHDQSQQICMFNLGSGHATTCIHGIRIDNGKTRMCY